MSIPNLIPGDATLIENIVNYLKAQGIFDEFRHECLADIDTKSSCQNLSQRVDGYTSKFLANETWHPDLNKNELRNKLRRHIDEAGFLAPGADLVVEQAIAPKTYYFLPKVMEVVHQYIKEQTELLNKKPETTISKSPVSEKSVNELENKDKTHISDPIADILSFSFQAKTENVQHKHGDTIKMEKKREEKVIPAVEKSVPELQIETITASFNETKVQLEKEKDKIKKEDSEIQQESLKKIVKDEVKSEKKKIDDAKASVNEIGSATEASKVTAPVSSKPHVSSKKDDKSKHKSKSQSTHKSSSCSSSETKKSKRESSEKTSEKSSEKLHKVKPIKLSKESTSSPSKSSSLKNAIKDEKGEGSKTKSHDTTSSKTSESSMKKSKSSSDKKDSSSKHKSHSEKTDKHKISKSVDKNESHAHHESSNCEKASKTIQYSSSYDSSQGSDQEKSASTNSKKEKSKHFSKHASKEKSDHDSSYKVDKRKPNSSNGSPSKKYGNEKDAKLKLKDKSSVEAAKISSRSNSFGSTSSVSSSSNTSKDNLTSNTDDVSENSEKDKKKQQPKEKDPCHNSPKSLPPPPPPPPPPPQSSSLTSELISSADISSIEDTQSSLSESETSSNEEMSEEPSSDSELESKDLINDTLKENELNSSTDNINAFYDIFLYSSSSSEFEGYGNSPEKKNDFEFANMYESDVSISSVHTSDLTSFDDELSSDDEVAALTGGLKKKLTLKEAQELIENLASLNAKKEVELKTQNEDSVSKKSPEKSSALTSEEELPSPEPVRSLRRERKLNPRYSSSEYTSIFNCKKETFITKQSSPSARSQTSASSPKVETKAKKTESLERNNKFVKECTIEDKKLKMSSDDTKISEKSKNKLRNESSEKDDELSDNKMSSADELDSFMGKEELFKENNKNNFMTDDDKLKDKKMLKPHNSSKFETNSHSLKRKLEISESTPMKRPCSRSSVDSSSSEFAPNENKPFNNEKKDLSEEKKLNDCSLKVSNLNIEIKKDIFCKQRANNNGDILGQKDIFPKNSHGKVINNSEKKINESDASKELNSL